MFNIGVPIDLNGQLNGRDVMVMQSAEDADFVIREFKHRYIRGIDAEDLLDEVLEDSDLTRNDFTIDDWAYIRREISRIVRF